MSLCCFSSQSEKAKIEKLSINLEKDLEQGSKSDREYIDHLMKRGKWYCQQAITTKKRHGRVSAECWRNAKRCYSAVADHKTVDQRTVEHVVFILRRLGQDLETVRQLMEKHSNDTTASVVQPSIRDVNFYSKIKPCDLVVNTTSQPDKETTSENAVSNSSMSSKSIRSSALKLHSSQEVEPLLSDERSPVQGSRRVIIFHGVSHDPVAEFDLETALKSRKEVWEALEEECRQTVGPLSNMAWLDKHGFVQLISYPPVVDSLMDFTESEPFRLTLVPIQPPSTMPVMPNFVICDIQPTMFVIGRESGNEVTVRTHKPQDQYRSYEITFTHQWDNGCCYKAKATLSSCATIFTVEVPSEIIHADETGTGLYDVHVIADSVKRCENYLTLAVVSPTELTQTQSLRLSNPDENN